MRARVQELEQVVKDKEAQVKTLTDSLDEKEKANLESVHSANLTIDELREQNKAQEEKISTLMSTKKALKEAYQKVEK